MKKWQNESHLDRILRLILAVITALAALNSHGAIMFIWWVVCAVAFVTGLIGFNLPYKLLGISTLKKHKRR